ncbi:MAG: hypothetical protein V1800_08020 [Candidatus Latescibacterota bacterium]
MNWAYGKLRQNRVEIELPRDWWQRGETSQGLPPKLCADGEKGVTELVLRFHLDAGTYAFSFRHGLVCEPADFSGQFWMLFFGEREIGCGGIAPIRLAPEEVAQEDTQTVRFRCERPGEHRMILLISNVDAYTDDAFGLAGIALCPVASHSARHSLLSAHPGRCFIDVWGWMNCLSYQRAIQKPPPPGEEYVEETRVAEWANYFVADLAYLRRNVIEESFRWGANGQECYLLDNCEGITHWPMAWPADDPIPGADTYNYMAPPYLQDEELRELARLAHRHDSLFHWYGHIPERDAYSWHRNYVGPGRTTQEWLFNLQSKLSRDFAYVLADREAALDGWAAEYMELMSQSESADEIAELTKRMWRYNPGAYLSDNVVNTWSRYRSCATPAFSHTLMSPSRDDGAPLDLYGDTFRHGRFGKTYFNLQGDCRPVSPNIFGGWIDPDFIIKQCNDFFRQRALEPDDIHATAVWWLGESRFTTPGVVRQYVYAASQDPIKVAAAYFLSTLGANGKLEEMGRRRPYKHTGVASAFYRRRCDFPPDTAMIHNNHLALYVPADAQGGILVLDTEGLAHYDGHGLNARLSDPLFTTEMEGGIQRVWTVTDFPEPAGYKAVLRQRLRLLGKTGGEITEERVYTAHNDTPYLRLKIIRRGESPAHCFLGAGGYDRLLVEGMEYREGEEIPAPRSFVFADSEGIRPSWAVVLLCRGGMSTIRWHPSEGVSFYGETGAAEDIVEMAFVALGSLYQEGDLDSLHAALLEDEVEGVALVEGMEVSNDLDLPRVVVARIHDPIGTPYLVREKGWWMFRGAQPALDGNCDFVKVYLPAQSQARIVRYGFIDGVVKPGWGSQYQIALGEIDGHEDISRCTVNVFSVTPLLFAPRVEFARAISWACVDGAPWQYFDGRFLFLPNQPGAYRVEVGHGQVQVPCLIRTLARIPSCQWKDDTLTIRAERPPWCQELHPKLRFTAAVSTQGYALLEVTGGHVLEQGQQGAIVEFLPGEVNIVCTRKTC